MENLPGDTILTIQTTEEIERAIKYSFKNKELLALSFVHRSYVNENKLFKKHNERLEFLGDSILSLIMAEYLFQSYPETSEGDLSFLRSRLIEASSCVIYIQKLNLSSFLLLGRGEKMNDGKGRESILADLFEALIGAIYLDGGFEAAKVFVFKNFESEIEAILKKPIQNWKALLQDYCQKNFQKQPEYKVINESGPDHSKLFQVTASLQEKLLGRGEGYSKKAAQQAAAKDALQKISGEAHGS